MIRTWQKMPNQNLIQESVNKKANPTQVCNINALSLVPDLILPALLEEHFLLLSDWIQGVHAHACSVTKTTIILGAKKS